MGFLWFQRAGPTLHCSSQASHCGVSCCKAQALWCKDSVVVARRLRCPAACRIFLEQGSNPCPMHWQVDSYHCTTRELPFIGFCCKPFASTCCVAGTILALGRSMWPILKKWYCRDFSGSPVIRGRHCPSRRGIGLILGWRTKLLQALQHSPPQKKSDCVEWGWALLLLRGQGVNIFGSLDPGPCCNCWMLPLWCRSHHRWHVSK